MNQVSKNAGQYKTNTPIPNMSHGIGKDINNPNIYVSSELTGKINLDIRDVFYQMLRTKILLLCIRMQQRLHLKMGLFYMTRTILEGLQI